MISGVTTSEETDTNGDDKKEHRLSPKMRAFLTAYEVDPCISRAAKASDNNRKNHAKWLRTNPRYAEEFEQAHQAYVDRLKREAFRRAVEGVPRRRFNNKGEPVYDPATGEILIERQFSDVLLKEMLRANADEYKPSSDLTIQGGVGVEHSGNITVAGMIAEMHESPKFVLFLQEQLIGQVPSADNPDETELPEEQGLDPAKDETPGQDPESDG